MNQKRIGIFLILFSVVLLGLFYKIKLDDEKQIQEMMEEQLTEEGTASCFLEDGTCLHQQENKTFFFGAGFALVLFALGMYLVFFDTTKETKELVAQQAEQNVQIATALKQAEEEKKKDVAFSAFLAGFTEEQQNVFKAIEEQKEQGILQSTLRYRTGLTKTDVSLMLKEFEEKGYITKKPEGNTNRIFLKKLF